MISALKKAGLAYLAFGLGMFVGSVIASTVAGLLLIAALDPEQLQKVNEEAERIKSK